MDEKICAKDMRPGLVFRDLVTVRPTDARERSYTVWECVCLRCGNTKYISSNRLLSGNDRSCGCFKAERNKHIKETLHFIDGTCLEWLKNRQHRSDNTSGFRGVSFNKQTHKWAVSIGFQGKRYFLGYFNDYEDAVQARLEAEERYYKPFIKQYCQAAQ